MGRNRHRFENHNFSLSTRGLQRKIYHSIIGLKEIEANQKIVRKVLHDKLTTRNVCACFPKALK